jgi:hypothetical protein
LDGLVELLKIRLPADLHSAGSRAHQEKAVRRNSKRRSPPVGRQFFFQCWCAQLCAKMLTAKEKEKRRASVPEIAR